LTVSHLVAGGFRTDTQEYQDTAPYSGPAMTSRSVGPVKVPEPATNIGSTCSGDADFPGDLLEAFPHQSVVQGHRPGAELVRTSLCARTQYRPRRTAQVEGFPIEF
jgi:hypothetical protein